MHYLGPGDGTLALSLLRQHSTIWAASLALDLELLIKVLTLHLAKSQDYRCVPVHWLYLYWDRFSFCSPGECWLRMILLLQPFECWDYRHEPPCLAFVLRICFVPSGLFSVPDIQSCHKPLSSSLLVGPFGTRHAVLSPPLNRLRGIAGAQGLSRLSWDVVERTKDHSRGSYPNMNRFASFWTLYTAAKTISLISKSVGGMVFIWWS